MIHTLMRSDLTMALMACVRDCSNLLASYPLGGGDYSAYVCRVRECRNACIECLEVLESYQVELRACKVQAAKRACEALISEYENANNPPKDHCLESCRRCIEECENVLA